MIIQWCVKGLSLPDDETARMIIDTRGGLLCNWWREVGKITPQGVRQRLTAANLDRHVNHYDEVDPNTSEPFRKLTPFISMSAGSVDRDTLAKTNRVHRARSTALWFGSEFGAVTTAYLYVGWVITAPRAAVEIESVAEEVRDLNTYRRYSDFQTEGENCREGRPSAQSDHELREMGLAHHAKPSDYTYLDSHQPRFYSTRTAYKCARVDLMSDRHLDQLGLSRDIVSRRIQFLVAYARTCLSEASDLDERAGEMDAMRQASRDARADGAGCFVEAAQLASLTNPEQALGLYASGASEYLKIDHPFGLFLRALIRPLSANEYAQGLHRFEAVHRSSLDREDAPPIWHAPQQQVYFLLALAGSTGGGDSRERLISVASSSAYRSGTMPVGALGTPVHRLWDVALTLLDREQDRDSAAERVCEHLAAMSLRYAERIELAQVNRWVWSHAAAPVDVGDTDIIGVTHLAVRVLSAPRIRQHLLSQVAQFPTLARVPTDIAMEWADGIHRERPEGVS